jgi:hypothetical protein
MSASQPELDGIDVLDLEALAFAPGVAERLGYYIYALRDPRVGEIFYVGKGKGDRAFQHARHAKKVDRQLTDAELKLERIKAIHAVGQQVQKRLNHPVGE